MAKVQMSDMAKTLKDLSTETAPVPTGIWYKLRAISLSYKQITVKPKNSDEYETDQFTLTVEPVTPGPSVDPAALAEIDEKTGKPAYEGSRVYCRFKESFRSDMTNLQRALAAFGFSEEPLHEGESTIADVARRLSATKAIRGRCASGDVTIRHYKRNSDGANEMTGVDQDVRSWSPEGSSANGLTI